MRIPLGNMRRIVVLSYISTTPATFSIAQGYGVQIYAYAYYSDGSFVNITTSASYSSSNTALATVNSSGFVTASLSNTGNVNITVTYEGHQEVVTGSITPAEVTYISVSPTSFSLPQGYGQQLTVTAHLSNGGTTDVTTSASYSSNQPSRMSVNGSGFATAGNTNGTSTITITYLGHQTTSSATTTAAIVEYISVSPTSFSLPQGLTQQLTVTAHMSNGSTLDVTYSSSYSSNNTSRATVSGGLVQASNSTTGAVDITATYNGHTAIASGTISAAIPQSISVSPDSFSINVSSSQQLTVTAHMSNGTTQNVTSSATYTRTNSNITVSSSGLVTGSSAGSSGVNISYGGYSTSASVTVTAVVKQLSYITVEPGIIYLAPGIYDEKTFQVRGYYNDSTNAILPTSDYSVIPSGGDLWNIAVLDVNVNTKKVYQEGPPYETSGTLDLTIVYTGSEGTPSNGLLSIFI